MNSLKAQWFGKIGLQESSQQHHALALHFAAQVEGSELFKTVYPVHWGLVCFQLIDGDNLQHEQVVRDLKRQHGVIMTTSIWHGEIYFRATFNQLTSSMANVERVFGLIQKAAADLQVV